MTSMLRIKAGDLLFLAAWEEEKAPKSCAAVRKLLPLKGKLIQARWSGEAAWISLDQLPLDIPYENATSYPARGEIVVHPGSVSVKEILIPYGAAAFASKVGLLAGNHFATIVRGQDKLAELGRKVLWEGAQDVEITEANR